MLQLKDPALTCPYLQWPLSILAGVSLLGTFEPLGGAKAAQMKQTGWVCSQVQVCVLRGQGGETEAPPDRKWGGAHLQNESR